jgi:VanZ family protein
MRQGFDSRFGWRLCSVLVLAVLIFASLLLPPRLEQLRTGHWEIEHFLAYLVAVPIICLGWPRPFLVAILLIPAAALLEALQCLQPGHSPNIVAALSSIGGVVIGALIAALMIWVLELRVGSASSGW